MLKKAFMLVSGNAFGSALLLVRNLIIARLISPEDYGIAFSSIPNEPYFVRVDIDSQFGLGKK